MPDGAGVRRWQGAEPSGWTALFLDRDGAINRKRREGDYVKRWEEFEFLSGALEALRLLRQVFPRIIVVTNQRGIARGVMTETDLLDIHQKMLAAVRGAGGQIDAVYYCPHDEGRCDCRKPGTALFQQAKERFPEIEFARSLVVGDSLPDLEAARRLGCAAALVAARSRQARILEQAGRKALGVSYVASSLLEMSTRLCGGTEGAGPASPCASADTLT